MKLEDSIALGLFVLAMTVLICMSARVWFGIRRKRDVQDLDATLGTGISAATEIEARLSIEFQQRIIQTERLWLMCLVGISIALVAVVYAAQLEKRHGIAAFTTLIASCAFICLRKRFAQSREEATRVSLSLCSQWLTYRFSSGENRIRLQSIERVSFSDSPYSNLIVATADGRTAQFTGFDNAQKIYISILSAIEHRKI